MTSGACCFSASRTLPKSATSSSPFESATTSWSRRGRSSASSWPSWPPEPLTSTFGTLSSLDPRQQSAVQGLELVHVLLDGLDRFDPGAEPAEKPWFLDETPELARQVVCVLQAEEEPVPLVAHELGHPTQVRCHHRDAGGEGLEDHSGTVLVPAGGYDEDVHPRENVAHLFAREGSGEVYPPVSLGQSAQLLHEGFEPLQVPVDVEGSIQFGRELPKSPDQDIAALVRRKGSYKADPVRRGEGSVLPSYTRGIYTVVGDFDLPIPYAVGDQQLPHQMGVDDNVVDQIHLLPDAFGTLL